MELPEWAKRALVPANPESEQGRWLAERAKALHKRWRDMQADKWRVPPEHHSYLQGHWDSVLKPADLVRQRILETALDLAWDRHCGKQPKEAAEAAKKVGGLNEQIGIVAMQLSALLAERAALVHANALDDQNEWSALDPFDFWDALDAAMHQTQFTGWAQTAQREISAFLRITREQSRAGPGWSDVLAQLPARLPAPVRITDAADAAAAQSKTNRTDFSGWALQLMGALDMGWRGTYPPGFLLGCLGHGQFATLVEIIFDASADVCLNEEQARKLRARYTSRKSSP